MGQIHCQVTIPHKSLIAADNVQNTFNFTGVDNVEDQAVVAKGLILSFYNVATLGGGNPVKNFMSGELNFANARIKIYDLSDPEPRVPILDSTLGTSAAAPAAASNYPGEVALGLSYSAEAESGVAAARRRGRIFLGPLNTGAGSGTSAEAARPSTACMTNVAANAGALADYPVGTQWCVWSRKNSAFYPIVKGYVDNAFDTQRRRGVTTTSRTPFTGGLG